MPKLPTPTEIHKTSKKHYEIYLKAKKENKINSVHRMILFYAVECRLKGLFYEKFKKQIREKPPKKRKDQKKKDYDLLKKQIERKNKKIRDLLNLSHELDTLIEELSKELNLPKMETCPKVKLMKDPEKKYDIKKAHAYWRYGYVMEDASEKALVRWLEGVYKKLKRIGGY